MKTKLEFALDDNEDSFYDDKITMQAHLKGPELALCLYIVREKIKSLFDRGNLLEEDFDILFDLIDDQVGTLDQYTR